MKRPTMTDVANLAGVSQGTVSLVLNNVLSARIAKGTRARVLEAARQLGYSRPLVAADRLRTIGIITDEIGVTPFFAPLIDGIKAEADAAGYAICIFYTHGSASGETTAIKALKHMGAEGIIYVTLIRQTIDTPPSVSELPTVLLNCASNDGRTPAVIPGDFGGGYTATQALLEAGHRRIAYFQNEADVPASKDRYGGYRQALVNWDIVPDKALFTRTLIGPHEGLAEMRKLLDLVDPPTAVFCYRDGMAIGIAEAIRERGLRIPDDISIVGFDNDPFISRQFEPPLTTVQLPHEDMGRLAVEMLLDYDNIKSAVNGPLLRKVECPLVVKSSIAPPRRP